MDLFDHFSQKPGWFVNAYNVQTSGFQLPQVARERFFCSFSYLDHYTIRRIVHFHGQIVHQVGMVDPDGERDDLLLYACYLIRKQIIIVIYAVWEPGDESRFSQSELF